MSGLYNIPCFVGDDAQLVSEETKDAFRFRDVFREAFSPVAVLKCAGHVAFAPSPIHKQSVCRRTACLLVQHLP